MRRPLIAFLVLALAGAAAQAEPDDAATLELQRQDRARQAEQLRARAGDAAREVERLRARLITLARDQSGDEGRASLERARFEALNAQEQALAGRMQANRGQLTRLLGALQLYSRNPPPALLVSPHSATDAVRAAILMRAITPDLQRRAAGLRAEAEAFQRVRREAALAGSALFSTESELAERRAEIERLIAQKQAYEKQLYADAEAADREARALAQRVNDLGGLMRGLPVRAASSEPVAGDIGRLTLPVRGVLVRRFGQQTPLGARSLGLSWRTEPGAQVLSPAGGRVDYAGPLKGWGQVVVIEVGGGWRVVVTGVERIDTATGRSVAAGEPIGRMTGENGARPELYMELRRDGEPVDPARRLDGG